MTTQLKELNRLLKEKKISIDELKELLTTTSDPWKEIRGILKNKKINPLKYQRKIRREWERNN